MTDPVNHPAHYTQGDARCSQCGHPIECIDVAEGHGFCSGNAIKYIWRHPYKGTPIEDLEKARWYIDREIERLKSQLTRMRPSGVGPGSD